MLLRRMKQGEGGLCRVVTLMILMDQTVSSFRDLVRIASFWLGGRDPVAEIILNKRYIEGLRKCKRSCRYFTSYFLLHSP